MTALRTVILDYCLETFYKKIKTNFSIHTEDDLRYLQDCYNILCKIHEVSGEDIECTFEEYSLMYYESIGAMGYDYTHSKDSIFNKDRLQLVYQEIVNSDGDVGYRMGDDEDDWDDDDEFDMYGDKYGVDDYDDDDL